MLSKCLLLAYVTYEDASQEHCVASLSSVRVGLFYLTMDHAFAGNFKKQPYWCVLFVDDIVLCSLQSF